MERETKELFTVLGNLGSTFGSVYGRVMTAFDPNTPGLLEALGKGMQFNSYSTSIVKGWKEGNFLFLGHLIETCTAWLF